jgi:rhamnose utilization protein RhaD (predicted bifunctional aldolase and dehydrogenase)
MLTENYKTAYDLVISNVNLSARYQKAGRKEKKEIEEKIQKNIDLMKKVDLEVRSIMQILTSDEVKKLALSKSSNSPVVTESFIFKKLGLSSDQS